MKFFHLFVFIFLVSFVSGASTINSFSAQGSGSIIRNLGHAWSAGSGDISLGGSSNSQLLTAPGDFQYQARDMIDATTNNRYNQTGYTSFSSGGVFGESLSMEETDMGQSAVVSHDGILQSAEISTAKFISDANMSMGQQAAWQGAGMFTRDVAYSVDIAQSNDQDPYHVKSDIGINYQAISSEHSMISTNATGGAIVRPEFSFIDFGDAYVVNKTSPDEINETANMTGTNITPMIEETP